MMAFQSEIVSVPCTISTERVRFVRFAYNGFTPKLESGVDICHPTMYVSVFLTEFLRPFRELFRFINETCLSHVSQIVDRLQHKMTKINPFGVLHLAGVCNS